MTKFIRNTALLALFIAGCSPRIVSQRAVPTLSGGRYSIQVENVVMGVDPQVGGRITYLNLDGKNFFTDNSVNAFNWGSTFWPSPQSDWNWPPSPEIDNKPYTAKVEDNEVIMVSQKDPKTGLVVTKAFSGDQKKGSMILKYTMTNQSDKPQKVAPWEVSRVRTHGIAFFPYGKGERTGGLLPSTKEIDGISWFIYDESKLPAKGVNRQLYSDGTEGWMAQLNGDILMIKKFPDVPFEKAAPKEGEVELFASNASPVKGYVEIEHQGAYEELKPGESSTWQVEWFLRKLPASIKPEAANPALVEYVRKIVR